MPRALGAWCQEPNGGQNKIKLFIFYAVWGLLKPDSSHVFLRPAHFATNRTGGENEFSAGAWPCYCVRDAALGDYNWGEDVTLGPRSF